MTSFLSSELDGVPVSESRLSDRGRDEPGLPVRDRRTHFSIVVPTLNEAESIPRIVEDFRRLDFGGSAELDEIIVVDDGSTDGTIEALERYARTGSSPRIRTIRRGTPRGPANAELCGVVESKSEWVVKIDADGQHPTSLIPSIVDSTSAQCDLVVASRYTSGGGNDWPAVRGLISRIAMFCSRILIPASRRVSDPVSGFFALRPELAYRIDPRIPRYKLLLAILAYNPRARVREIPFTMHRRSVGESKIVGRSVRYVPLFFRELLGYLQVSHGKPRASPLGTPSLAPPAQTSAESATRL